MKIPDNYIAKFRCYGCMIKIKEFDFDEKVLNGDLIKTSIEGSYKTFHKNCFENFVKGLKPDTKIPKIIKPKITIEMLLKCKSNMPIGIIGERSEVLDIKMIKEDASIPWEELKNGGCVFVPFGSITENSFKLLLFDICKKYNAEYKYVAHFDKKVYEVGCVNKRWFK